MPKSAESTTRISTNGSSLRHKTNTLPSKKIAEHLTKLEAKVLSKFIYYSSNAYFLSLHDLRRIMPYKIQKIERSVTCLRNLGLIKTAEANKIIHYCTSEQLSDLRKRIREISINDQIEGEVINTVREALKKLYPNVLTINSEAFEVSYERRGFDIVLELTSSVINKRFVVVDVYTIVPVTKEIVQSFIRKIRTTRNETDSSIDKAEKACYPLRDKTLGIIIYNKASQKAVEVARECDISLMHFRDIHINYNQMHKRSHLIQLPPSKKL